MCGRKGIRSGAGSHGGGARRQPMVVEGPPCACRRWRWRWRRACERGLAAARVLRSGFLLVCVERKSVKMTMGQKIFGLRVSGLDDMPSDGIGLVG